MMAEGDIAFPNLGIYLHNVPRGFSVFGFTITLYGIIIGIGMILAVMLCDYDRKSRGLSGDDIWNLAVIGIPIGIICARIYYVIFEWDMYKNDLLSIFNTRQGGLAIYGGVIGGFLTVFVYAKVKKQSFFELCDTIALGFPVGQLMGRWGNFFNREVFGGYTDNLLAMRLPVAAVRGRDITPELQSTIVAGTNYIQVHPTFLYESLWNLGLLIILFLYRKHKKFAGEIFCMYIAGYGLGRFWIEYIRTDQLYITGTRIPVSMVVAACMIAAAAAVSTTVRIKMAREKHTDK